MSTLPAKLQQWQEELHRQSCKKLAYTIIQDYFNHYTARELQQELWSLISSMLTHPEADLAATPIDRHNRLFFYEFHLLMLEALQVILQKNTELWMKPV